MSRFKGLLGACLVDSVGWGAAIAKPAELLVSPMTDIRGLQLYLSQTLDLVAPLYALNTVFLKVLEIAHDNNCGSPLNWLYVCVDSRCSYIVLFSNYLFSSEGTPHGRQRSRVGCHGAQSHAPVGIWRCTRSLGSAIEPRTMSMRFYKSTRGYILRSRSS